MAFVGSFEIAGSDRVGENEECGAVASDFF
jgi:hypothetical protein